MSSLNDVSLIIATYNEEESIGFVLDEIVKENQEKFIQFYNHAGPISRRYHSLELIPGLGKKTMNLIVSNRPYSLSLIHI